MNEGKANEGSVCYRGASACRWCQLSLVRERTLIYFLRLKRVNRARCS